MNRLEGVQNEKQKQKQTRYVIFEKRIGEKEHRT